MNDSSEQMRSRSYLLPAVDASFLLRDEMRATRFALEYAKADLLLRDWGIRSTIIVFGSSRIPSLEQAECAIEGARAAGNLQEVAYLSKQVSWYEAAREFARIASRRGGAFAPQHRWTRGIR